ncbi:MAG: hypothetical protein V1678_05445 [Candidatus Aenigmatarchaeota archaeon]
MSKFDKKEYNLEESEEEMKRRPFKKFEKRVENIVDRNRMIGWKWGDCFSNDWKTNPEVKKKVEEEVKEEKK